MSDTEDFSIMATSNLMGRVKLFKITDQKPDDSYNMDLVHEFKDHMFPVNDI